MTANLIQLNSVISNLGKGAVCVEDGWETDGTGGSGVQRSSGHTSLTSHRQERSNQQDVVENHWNTCWLPTVRSTLGACWRFAAHGGDAAG